MPLFFFHLRTDRGLEVDDVGSHFADLDAAYLDVCRAIPDMLGDLLRDGRDPMGCTFEVVDERGRGVMEVPFAERLTRRPARPAPAADDGGMAADALFRRAASTMAEARALCRAVQDARRMVATAQDSRTPFLDMVNHFYRSRGLCADGAP